jgi:hypothetical protein
MKRVGMKKEGRKREAEGDCRRLKGDYVEGEKARGKVGRGRKKRKRNE